MTEERTSGADSGLANVWDEICVQIQGEESIHWAAYDDTVRQIIRFDLKQISDVELESIWVQTDSGWDWWDQEEARDRGNRAPVNIDEVVEHIVTQIYDAAANWSNPRIRAFLESPSEMDY